MFCREHAAQVRGRYEEIRQLGAEVVAIGTGNADYARSFIADEDIPFPVLLDDEAEAARAVGVRRGKSNDLLGPRNWGGALRATMRGHRQRRNGARPGQLGGTFVVMPGGAVIYEHRAKEASDNPRVDEVIAALVAAAG